MIRLNPMGEAATDADVKALEELLDVRLPADFRAFLLQTNTARPEPNIFPVGKKGRHGSVQCFLGLGKDVSASLVEKLGTFRGRLQRGVVPIAEAEGGDLVCLGTEGGRRGTVYYWDHEMEGLGPARALRPVSKSFAEFFASLTPFSAQDVDTAGVQVRGAWIDPDFLRDLKRGG